MRKSTRVLLIGAALWLVAGCERPTAPPPPAAASKAAKGTFGISLMTMANPFFKDMADAMTKEAKQHGFDVLVYGGEMDPAKQADQVKDFIAKKVSAIILAPVDAKSIGTAIAEANKAKIPVFTADTACLDKTAQVVCHVATDNLAGGVLAGETMVKLLGGKGKVAIIDHPEAESVIKRTTGFHSVVDKATGIKIVAQLPGKGDRAESLKTAQDILTKNPDLDAIFAINDPSALGAIAALEAAGRAGKVKVIGFDGMPEAKQAVKAGKLVASIIQYPEKIGVTTIQQVVDYLSGKKVEAQILMKTGVYDKAEADKDPAK